MLFQAKEADILVQNKSIYEDKEHLSQVESLKTFDETIVSFMI